MVKFSFSLFVFASSFVVNAQRDEKKWEDDYNLRKQLTRSSSQQFSGWIGPITYDGVNLVAIGADTGSFSEVLPAATLGCTVFQPAKGWGYNDFFNICEAINTAGGLDTDCQGFDDDSNGGLCPNVAGQSMILTYENWGTGESTGPDVWASSATFVEETLASNTCNPTRNYDGCVFPTQESQYDDCVPVAHTWSVVVYACEDFNSPDKTSTVQSFAGPQDLLGECSAGATDSDSLYGCWCAALVDGANPLMGRPRDEMDEACLRYAHCMRCNSCGTRDFFASVTDCNNIDCHGSACCECAADFAADANGLTMDPNNLNLDSNTCVRTIVPPNC